jgi:hypothetical protein
MQTCGDTSIKVQPKTEKGGFERRRSRRYPCRGFVEVVNSSSHMLFRGEVQNLSKTGCFVVTKACLRLEPMHIVDLRMSVKNISYSIHAKVVYVRLGEGLGLEFLPPDPVSEERLNKLLQILAEASSIK